MTQRQRKQKLIELEHNAPIKIAKLLVMKGLGLEYLNSNGNGKFCFDMFFTKKKEIFIHGLRKSYYDGTLEDYIMLVKSHIRLKNKLLLIMSLFPLFHQQLMLSQVQEIRAEAVMIGVTLLCF